MAKLNLPITHKRASELNLDKEVDDDESPLLIEQMRKVNELIKANKISTKLAAQIFEICKKLKICGKEMEETHGGELDTFFASLRQANCRENGELGLPCRLKMMELLELRAMGWRSNLSHAKYYAKREDEIGTMGMGSNYEQQLRNNEDSSQFQLPSAGPSSSRNSPALSNAEASSASFPFCSSSVPLPLIPPQQLMAKPSPPSDDDIISLPPGAGFRSFVPSSTDHPPPLFHPSTSNFFPSPPQQFFPHGFFTNQQGPLEGQLPFNFYPQKKMSANARCFVPNLLDGMTLACSNELSHGGRAVNNNRQQNQLREELMIRNSDSGKVMGVKGRRVALIEEISKTVISFQKVDPKCKERQLTILGDSKEAIEQAKRLIGVTIERNVSPERETTNQQTESTDDEKKPVKEPFIVEKSGDGALKISAEDPALLEAIREALNAHLEREKKTREKTDDDDEEQPSEFRKPIDDGTEVADEAVFNGSSSTPFVYDRDQLLSIRDNAKMQIDVELAKSLADCELFVVNAMHFK